MVVPDRRRPRGRLRGKLTGDPIVEAAAAVLAFGVDPSVVFDWPVEDRAILQATLDRAQHIRIEYDQQLAESIGAHAANKTVPGIAKPITRLVVALARASRG